MATKIKGAFKIVKRPDGRLAISHDEKAAEAKLDLCTRLKRRNSKKVTVVKKCN